MTSQSCIHCYVSGKVQGVWFRASTKEEAERLGLKGWVRNLADGRVEVLACGTPEHLEMLHEWLQQGPTLAHVSDCAREDLNWANYDRFDVL